MFGAHINLQQQSDPRSDRCGKIVLAWILVIGIIALLFIFASHLSASLITFLIVLFTVSFTVYYYYSPILEIESVEELRTSQTGLSPSQIKEIPSFAYQWKHQDLKNSNGCDTADLTCAVCIATVQDGVMVRQLPVCMHLFHTNCIDTWLSSHTTCPMCRADVQTGKLYPENREPPV